MYFHKQELQFKSTPDKPDAVYARRLSSVQTWVFVTAVAVGAATGSIAEDRARGSERAPDGPPA